MEIYCKNTNLLELAIRHAEDTRRCKDVPVVTIKRLPPQFPQKGLIEYPRTLGKRVYMDIFIKMDEERETTLAHEFMHVKQILTDGKIDENEAYLYEKQHLNGIKQLAFVL